MTASPVAAPGCRVRQDDLRRRLALAFRGPVHHPAGHGGEDFLGRQGERAHGDRHVVSDPAFEFPDHPVGGIEAAAFRGLPHQDGAFLRVIHHGGHRRSAEPQRQALRNRRGNPVSAGNGGGGKTGPDINGENVAHGYLGKTQHAVRELHHRRASTKVASPIRRQHPYCYTEFYFPRRRSGVPEETPVQSPE